MRDDFFSKTKRLISSFIATTMLATMLPAIPASAKDNVDKYPYTLFAASNEEGAITFNAGNFCVNGNVATNGTIVSSGNMNINGTKTESANEEMLYIFDKIDAAYFSGGNVDEHTEDYTLEEMNINVNIPTEVKGEATLTGNININTALKAFEDVSLFGEVKNTNDSVIFSKYGDIIIDSQNVNLNGLVYAPFGDVEITAQNFNLNNVVIIADTITFNCPNCNANYSSTAGNFVGYASEAPLHFPVDEWEYLPDENENGLPDFFEHITNWGILEDFDEDSLPDVIEIWIGSNPNEKDSDGDGLRDYYEMFINLTDLTLADTDNNGIIDGDEDFDEDGLSTLEEYQLGSHPLYADTDGDGLNDYDELMVHFTNPNKMDTDKDGADDKWEIDNGFDPNDSNESFSISAETEGNEVSASVSLNASGKQVKSLKVESADNIIMLDDTIPGYVGSPFNFEIDGTFEYANISFTFNSELLNDEKFVPTIYYFNKETQLFEEMLTTVEGNVASTITTHFSVYVLLNKTTYEAAWQEIKAPNNNGNISKINIAFVLDTSGSMGGNKLSTAKTVIGNFIENIQNNSIRTDVSLVNFESQASIQSYLSNDYNAFLQSLNGLYAGGGTAIYTGIAKAFDVLLYTGHSSLSSYDAIIVLTDGYDEPAVPFSTYQPYINMANNSGINIYTIGVGTIDEQLLIKIADKTDGKYFFANNASMLYEIYEEIESEIIDYTTDSNNDGICDYYTKLLCNGTLRIGTQCDIFAGVSYEAFNANNDYDGDGIINGDEFEVKRDESTGHIYVYLHSNPVEPDSDFDGMNDSMDSKPFDPNVGLLIYQTLADDNHIKSLPLAERPEDFQYGDKTVSQLTDMRYINWTDFAADVEDYEYSWKTLVKTVSMGEMQTVAIDMVNHFMGGTGSDYHNDVLSKNVKNHDNTALYVSGVTDIIDESLVLNNGNISELAYINSVEERINSVMVERMINNGINQPIYNDKLKGLGICVDGLFGNRIEVTSYNIDGQSYEYTLRFTMYDIFGLDSADIEASKYAPFTGFGTLGGFRSWYILQHCNLYEGDYQPYISYMTFEKSFTGTI